MLLDEDVPRKLKGEFAEHEVFTVVEMGWGGIKSRALLGLAAAAGFDALLTCDRNMQRQQTVAALGLALAALAVPNKRLDTVRQLVPEILALLD